MSAPSGIVPGGSAAVLPSLHPSVGRGTCAPSRFQLPAPVARPSTKKSSPSPVLKRVKKGTFVSAERGSTSDETEFWPDCASMQCPADRWYTPVPAHSSCSTAWNTSRGDLGSVVWFRPAYIVQSGANRPRD